MTHQDMNNDKVNPYEIGKAGQRSGNWKYAPIGKDCDNENKSYSIVPPIGAYGKDETGELWPSSVMSAEDGLPGTFGPSLPEGFQGKISSAGWTKGAEGFPQQTFLGASITNFDIKTGFGNSSSSLNVSLVVDEYNGSDGTWYGSGDDVYHRGVRDYQGKTVALGDQFIPPTVGTPVFFKFGGHHCTVAQAWLKTYYQKYGGRFIREPDSKYEAIPREGAAPDFSARNEDKYLTLGNAYRIQGERYFLEFDQTQNIAYADIKHGNNDTRYIWEDKSVQGYPVAEYFGDERDIVGWNHFVFGGILSSVSNSVGGSDTFSVTVTDPREILQNTTLILSDYAGTTFSNKNMYNIFGFLEYDFSEAFMEKMKDEELILESRPLTKGANDALYGNDTYLIDSNVYSATSLAQVPPIDCSDEDIALGRCPQLPPNNVEEAVEAVKNFSPTVYPMTGQGFSRKTDRGMPVYRINQALSAMFNYEGRMWQEHIDGGFGGPIDFRGYNYVVDLGGIPFSKIPPLYKINQSQIDLLSYIQEICDTVNHDYFISLLPVLNVAPTHYIWKYNQQMIEYKRYGDVITGIIRVDTVDRSVAPEAGSIEKYMNFVTENKYTNTVIAFDKSNTEYQGGIDSFGNVNSISSDSTLKKYIESRNIGYDLTNETTDRFVAGAQEVNMYAFSTCKDGLKGEYCKGIQDRNNANRIVIQQNPDSPDNPDVVLPPVQRLNEISNSYHKLKDVDMWSLSTMLKQQVLPFYGFLGDKAVTIPLGFGPFQQIMLDSSKLQAANVGDYYIATQMELRAAQISYQAWSQFLKFYNERYVEFVNTFKEAVEIKDEQDNPIKPFADAVDTKDKIVDIDKIIQNFHIDIRDNHEAYDGYPWSQPWTTAELKSWIPTVKHVVSISDEASDSDTEEDKYYQQLEACSVPRCAFNSASPGIRKDGLPIDACSPPYGYPLYYKRSERIGIAGGGYVDILQEIQEVKTSQERKIKELKERRVPVYPDSPDARTMIIPDDEFTTFIDHGSSVGFDENTYIGEKVGDEFKINIVALKRLRAQLMEEKREIIKRYGFAGGIPPESNTDPRNKRFYDETRPLSNLIRDIEAALAEAASSAGNTISAAAAEKIRLDKYLNYQTIMYNKKQNGQVFEAASKGAEINIENSKKIYAWLKNIADEHLGKKFLVKIPRYTNINYKFRVGPTDKQPSDHTAVTSGPFGFPPRYNEAREHTPEGAFPYSGYYNPTGLNTFADWGNSERFHHFLLKDSGNGAIDKRLRFREGALRSSWNEIDDYWEHNYKPENQGGFFDWTMWNSGIADQNRIYPRNPEFMIEGYRIKPYVRYDHSQFYDTSKIQSSNNVSEEINVAGPVESFVTDLFLGFHDEEFTSLDIGKKHKDKVLKEKGDKFTYVQASMDDRFYMPPKTTMVKSHVYGDCYTWVPADLAWSNTKHVFDKDSDELRSEFTVKTWQLPPLQWRPGNTGFWNKKEVGERVDGQPADYIWYYKTPDNYSKIIQKDILTFYLKFNSSEGMDNFINANLSEGQDYRGLTVSEYNKVGDEDGASTNSINRFGPISHQYFPFLELYTGNEDGYYPLKPNNSEYFADSKKYWLEIKCEGEKEISQKFIRDAAAGVCMKFPEVKDNEGAGEIGGDITGRVIDHPYQELLPQSGEGSLDRYNNYVNGIVQKLNDLKSYYDSTLTRFNIALLNANSIKEDDLDPDAVKLLKEVDDTIVNPFVPFRSAFPESVKNAGNRVSVTGMTTRIEAKLAHVLEFFESHNNVLLRLREYIESLAEDSNNIASTEDEDFLSKAYVYDPVCVEDFVRDSKIQPIEWGKSVFTPNKIVTKPKELDDQHVYAIVTLPGAVTADVEGFHAEAQLSNGRNIIYAKLLSSDVTGRFDYHLKYDSGCSFGDDPSATRKGEDDTAKSPSLRMENVLGPNQPRRYMEGILNELDMHKNDVMLSTPETEFMFANPTPITPNLFVLPLMSTERCYGPWLSSASGGSYVGMSDIGGKVEFIKDEDLAPWSYGGYYEMDAVGISKAQFSNSLQLFNEKGSFTMADAPTGISIAHPLIAGGPLVTSISVSVSTGGIKTVVNMDSYSLNFGQLSKQKEAELSKLKREKQKLIDQMNELERNGILKRDTPRLNGYIGDEMAAKWRDTYKEQSDGGKESSIVAGHTAQYNIVYSANPRISYVNTPDGKVIEKREFDPTCTIQHDGYLTQAQEMMDDPVQIQKARQSSAGNPLNSMFVGFDNSIVNQDLTTRDYNPISAKHVRMRF